MPQTAKARIEAGPSTKQVKRRTEVGLTLLSPRSLLSRVLLSTIVASSPAAAAGEQGVTERNRDQQDLAILTNPVPAARLSWHQTKIAMRPASSHPRGPEAWRPTRMTCARAPCRRNPGQGRRVQRGQDGRELGYAWCCRAVLGSKTGRVLHLTATLGLTRPWGASDGLDDLPTNRKGVKRLLKGRRRLREWQRLLCLKLSQAACLS